MVNTTQISAASSGHIQSVARAAAILQAFAVPDQHLSITDVARLLDVHKSTASRLVATLVHAGLLESSGAGSITLGPEVRRLGRLASGTADLAELARDMMQDLAAETGETVTLSVRDGDHAVTIAQCGGTHRIGVQSWVGARTPLASTADGKVLLAFDGAGTTVPRSVRAELSGVVAAEWASARGELEDGLFGVAVPVWDGHGTFLAALCVSGPSYRVGVERFDDLATRCRAAAYRLTDSRQRHLEHSA